MGMRIQVTIINADVDKAFTMYSHWGASTLDETMKMIKKNPSIAKPIESITSKADLKQLAKVTPYWDEMTTRSEKDAFATEFKSIKDFMNSKTSEEGKYGDEGNCVFVIKAGKVAAYDYSLTDAYDPKFVMGSSDYWTDAYKMFKKTLNKALQQTEEATR